MISGDDPVACEFDTVTGGQYRITAKVFDDEEGTNTTELTRFVSGAEAVATRSVDQQVVTLVPDATDHAPGDTAEVLVISPFVDGHGLLTVTRDRIVETRSFELDDGSAVLDIDLTDASVPGVDVHVDIAGSAPRIGADGRAGDDLPPRPAFASGDLPISVQAHHPHPRGHARPRPPPRSSPGASTSVAVSVVGPDGSPAAERRSRRRGRRRGSALAGGLRTRRPDRLVLPAAVGPAAGRSLARRHPARRSADVRRGRRRPTPSPDHDRRPGRGR